MYSIANIVMAIPAVYIVNKTGIKWGLTTGMSLYMVGNCANLLIDQSYYFIIIGQFIAGLGLPIVLTCQAPFCNNWYNLTSRPLIVSLTSIANPLGFMLAFVLPSVFIPTRNSSPEEIRQGTTFYTGTLAAIYLITTILVAVFFRSRPPLPKDKIEAERITEVQEREIRVPVIQQYTGKAILKSLFTDSVWILAFLVMFFGYGTVSSQSALLTEILSVYGYADGPATILGGNIILVGLLAAVIYGVFWINKPNQIGILAY